MQDDAQIKTSVNIALNQDDMVELILDQQKEEIEAQLDDLHVTTKDVIAKYNEEKDRMSELILELNNKRDHELTEFMGIAKKLKYTIIDDITVIYRKDIIGEFREYPLENFEFTTRPMSQLKKMRKLYAEGGNETAVQHNFRAKFKKHEVDVPEEIRITIYAESKSGKTRLSYTGDRIQTIKTNIKIKNAQKELNTLAKQWFELDKKKHDLEIEMFILENDTKRSKNKFVKSLLKNTESGASLVKLLGEVKKNGVSLLD